MCRVCAHPLWKHVAKTATKYIRISTNYGSTSSSCSLMHFYSLFRTSHATFRSEHSWCVAFTHVNSTNTLTSLGCIVFRLGETIFCKQDFGESRIQLAFNRLTRNIILFCRSKSNKIKRRDVISHFQWRSISRPIKN